MQSRDYGTPTSPFDPNAILEVMLRHGVDFIIVGGVGCALQGASISTFDLDLVHSRTPENVDRLLAALKELDARHRDLAGRLIRPRKDVLLLPGHSLLVTNKGPLDMLGAIARQRDYEKLLPETITVPLSKDMNVKVLKLEALIREKEELARDKDKAVIRILRNTLKERNR